MKKIENIPLVPACEHIAELNRLTLLICEYIQPEAIILYGDYARTAVASPLKGYEMLILTGTSHGPSSQEISAYLNVHYPIEERQEKTLSLCLFTTDIVRQMTSRSYFLHNVRTEGILLYPKESYPLPDHLKWKPTRAFGHLVTHAGRSLNLGKTLAGDAGQNFRNANYRLAAFYLFQATREFIHALLYIQYGFIPETNGNIYTAYEYIRHCSEQLIRLDSSENIPFYQFLKRLSCLYELSLSENTYINPNVLPVYLEKLQSLEIAAGQLYTEKAQLLGSLQNT